jgi:WD40 repeat protein
VSALLRIVLVFCFFGVGCANATDNKRLALVIANSKYQRTAALKNPPNDSNLIAAKLRDLGFQVQVENDLDAKAFSRIIQGFASKLDKNTDALFYYAGHGLQYQGENYLVAVDAKLESEATIQFETFRLNTAISLIESKANTALIFWDACRNNPLANGLQIALRVVTDSSPAVRASAPIPPSRGDTLVVFSAEQGRFALDGLGDFSPFAEALAKHVATPNLEIEVMLKRVKADVLAKTKDQQPQVLSQLAKEFYFNQQETEQLAYKQELDALRTKLDKLEHPAPEKHFEIVPSESVAKQDSPLTQTTPTEAPSPASPPIASSKSAAKHELPSPEITPAIAPSATPPPPSTANANLAARQESPFPQPAPAVAPSATPPPPASPGEPTSQPTPTLEPNIAKQDVVVSVNSSQSTIIRKLRIAPDAKLLALGADDGTIRIVSLETFEVVQTIRAHQGRISDLDFSPDSRTLLSAGRDGFLRFWDVKVGQKIRDDLRVANSVPYAARLNPEFPERYVLMGDREGRLLAWDLARNDRLVVNGKFHNGPVQSVAYQPLGKGTYLSAGGDGLLKVRLPEGQRLVVHAHAGPIFAAGYNQSGNLIYTAGSDRKIKIWDPGMLRNREDPLAVLQGHLKYVLAATVSLDGKTMATGGGDKAIDLWEVASRKLIGRLLGHTSDIEALAFTPNSRFVISASEDRTVRVWSVDGQKELVRLFFRNESSKYAGATYDNKSFGDRDAGVMTVFVDGRAVAESNAAYALNYIGHGISIVDVKGSPP